MCKRFSKCLSVTFIALFCCNNTSAQIEIGPEIMYGRYKANTDFAGSKVDYAFASGFVVTKQLSSNCKLKLRLNYERLDYEYWSIGSHGARLSDTELHFLNTSILMNYRLSSKFSIEAGGVMNYMLKGCAFFDEIGIGGRGPYFYGCAGESEGRFKRQAYSGEMALNYHVGELVLSARYRRGFSRVLYDAKLNHLSLGISYLFKI